GATIREPLVAILPDDEFARHEGRLNDGVLGKDIYARFVVDIEYARRRLTLRNPAAWAYHGTGIAIPLHVIANGTAAWMPARITFPGVPPIDVRLAIDVGTYSALRFYSPFVKQHHLIAEFGPNAVPSYGFGLGGEFPVRVVRTETLAVGPSLSVAHPVAELSLADSGATTGSTVDGTIGGAILSCFHVIVDYTHARMILEPNGRTCAAPDADMSGLVLDAGGPGLKLITVGHVLDGTPAAQAGFREGDRLVSIDSAAVDTLGLLRVQTLLSHPATYRVSVERSGATRDLVLRTQSLIDRP
ncbi:MAG: PDZ domain-containing protein, partial [Gemmatimonadaceae bacterium]